MKKHLLILATLTIGAFSAKAQIINATEDNFETWTADAYSTGNAPDPNSGVGNAGWWDFNILSNALLGGSPISVTEGTSSPSPAGGHYAIITSVVLTSTSWGYVKSYGVPDTSGMIMLGKVTSTPSISTGVPFTQRLTQLNFYYQYAPNGVDTASCSLVLTHYSGGKRHTLGAGIVKYSSTVSTWTMGTVNMFYDSATGNPDTAFVVFSSSGLTAHSKPKAGSVFMIDGVSVVGIADINAPTVSINVYPSPATSYVNFQVTSMSTPITRADIYDITGQKVNSYNMHNNLLTMSTQGYAAGLYFYQLYDKNGSLLKSGKFSIAGK